MKKQIKKDVQCVDNEIDSESSNSESDSEFVITELSESEKHKSRSIWSLKGLSSQIKFLVNELQSTTYKQLATILIDRLSNELQQIHGTERRKEIQNLKRRVYDAINVMVAMKVLTKEKKIISFRQPDRGMLIEEKYKVEHRARVILSKRKKLTHGTITYLLLKDLVERNQETKLENEIILQMPVIGVSVALQGNDFQMCQKSRRKLLLKSKKPIHIYSELDILHKVID